MVKTKIYLSSKSGKAWKASRVPPPEGRQAVEISTDIRLFPAFSGAAPTSVDPIKIQKIVITEGPLPKGGVAQVA